MNRKCALVTGGSRGIGREICKLLSTELGYHVLINYIHNERAANEVFTSITQNGGSAECIKFDVSNEKEVNASLIGWMESNPNDIIEVVVNNAGIRRDGILPFMDNESWNEVINIKVNGFFYTSKLLIPMMLSNKYGRIINMASVIGLEGNAGQVNYSAANGALIAATKACSKELAKKNITVNAVAPGFIMSELIQDLNQEELKKMIPANRLGDPEEVAALVCFLASKKASYITGEVIKISGGI